MALQTEQLVNGVKVYWVRLSHQGIRFNQRIGHDKEAAKRIHKKLKADPSAIDTSKPSLLIRVRPWLTDRLSKRTGRAAEGEGKQIEDYIFPMDWFMSKRVCDVDAHDIRKIVEDIRATGKLAESTITNIHSTLSGCFQWAVFDKLLISNPCRGLPKGILKRGGKKKREPYTRTQARSVMECEKIRKATRMWLYLAFYTGMREGEVCGRKFKDWKHQGDLMGALHIHDQYNGQPLKTESENDDEVQPRWVPIHRELEKMLMWWWEEGFEEVYCRQPTPEDFIVPTSAGINCHSRSSAYKAFRTALRQANVPNKTLHSTRHTFVSVARAGHAREDMVERITHNAKGTTLDKYTKAEWELLCEIVSGVDYSIDRVTTADFASAGPPQRNAAKVGQVAATTYAFDFVVGHSTIVTFEGRSLTVSAWEKETGIPRKTIADRLNLGWSIERSLTTPIDCRRQRVTSSFTSGIQKQRENRLRLKDSNSGE